MHKNNPKIHASFKKFTFILMQRHFNSVGTHSPGICVFITDKNQRYMVKERDFGDQYLTFFVTGFGEGKYTNARTPTKTFFEERRSRDAT
jgi:hypothetical protein